MNIRTVIVKTVAAAAACGLLCASGMLAVEAYRRRDVINGQVMFADPSVGTDWVDSVYVQSEIVDQENNQVKAGIRIEPVLGSSQTENFFDSYQYDSENITKVIAPGDKRVGYVTISNDTADGTAGQIPVKVYLYARATGDTTRKEYETILSKNPDLFKYRFNGTTVTRSASQLKSLSEAITKEAKLTIYMDMGTGDEADDEVIYQGRLDGSSGYADGAANGASLNTKYTDPDFGKPASDGTMTNAGAPIYLGAIPAGIGGVSFRFELEIPADLDNTYRSSVVMIDWVFMAITGYEEGKAAPHPDPTTTPSTTTPTPTPTPTPSPEIPIPKTGDAAIPYTLASMACAMSAVVIFVLAFRTKRRDIQAA